YFVIDISVWNSNIGNDEISNGEALDHLLDDEGSEVLISTDGIVSQVLFDKRSQGLFPKNIAIDFVRPLAVFALSRLNPVRHDHKTQRSRHMHLLRPEPLAWHPSLRALTRFPAIHFTARMWQSVASRPFSRPLLRPVLGPPSL